MSDCKYPIGSHVVKRKGYLFPGVVIGVAKKLNGKLLYLVECDAEEVAGICHIFAEDDIRLSMQDPCYVEPFIGPDR